MVAGVLIYLWLNLVTNMQRLGLPLDFAYLDRAAGFGIAGADFSRGRSVRAALIVGARNTLIVSSVGILLATVLGIVVGIARLSTNWLVNRAASFFVEAIRNIPVLAIIIFWSTAAILKLPRIEAPLETAGGTVILSNRGLWIPWFVGREAFRPFLALVLAALAAAVAVAVWRTRRHDRTGRPHHRVAWGAAILLAIVAASYLALGGPVEVSLPERTARAVAGGIAVRPDFAALLAGLVVYTASHIAEITRGAIQAVPRGQTDAAMAIGLSGAKRLRFVVLPQAFRIAVPPLANQFLNLTKNSSLGIAVGYAELMTITQIVIANANPAPQSIAILMMTYLSFSLAIAAVTNLVNRRLQRIHR